MDGMDGLSLHASLLKASLYAVKNEYIQKRKLQRILSVNPSYIIRKLLELPKWIQVKLMKSSPTPELSKMILLLMSPALSAIIPFT